MIKSYLVSTALQLKVNSDDWNWAMSRALGNPQKQKNQLRWRARVAIAKVEIMHKPAEIQYY